MSTLVCLCPIISFISYLSIVGSYHICVVLRVRLHVCLLSASFCSLYWFLSLSRSFVPSRDPCYFSWGHPNFLLVAISLFRVTSLLLSMSLCLWIFVKCVFFRLQSCFLSFLSFCSFIIIWCSIFAPYIYVMFLILCLWYVILCFVPVSFPICHAYSFFHPRSRSYSFSHSCFFSLYRFLSCPLNSIKLVFR